MEFLIANSHFELFADGFGVNKIFVWRNLKHFKIHAFFLRHPVLYVDHGTGRFLLFRFSHFIYLTFVNISIFCLFRDKVQIFFCRILRFTQICSYY